MYRDRDGAFKIAVDQLGFVDLANAGYAGFQVGKTYLPLHTFCRIPLILWHILV